MSTRKILPAPVKGRTTRAQWSRAFDTADACKKGWTPRRRGPFYCSPRCGASCTYAAFMTATRKAAALCKRLGPGWEPRVWENMGWHYSVQKGVIEIHTNFHKSYPGGVSYSVFFNTAKQFVTSSCTPEAALRLALDEARLAVRKINRDLRAVAA